MFILCPCLLRPFSVEKTSGLPRQKKLVALQDKVLLYYIHCSALRIPTYPGRQNSGIFLDVSRVSGKSTGTIILYRVATFRFRLNSLCFPCVHDQFPCVFQYINNKYYFYKWPPPPLTAILSSLLFNNNITS